MSHDPEAGISRGLARGFYLLLSLIGVVVLVARGDLVRLCPGPPHEAIAMGVVAGLGLALLGRISSMVPALRRTWAELGRMIGSLSPSARVELALLSGVGEELLFRGALQPVLGFWLTCVLFAALHTGPRAKALLPWTISAFLAGAGLGMLADTSGGVLAAAIAHGVSNFIGFGLVARLAAEPSP